MSARTTGRVMGALFLAQLAIVPMVYMRLLPPGNGRGYLDTAVANAPEVRLAVLLATLLAAVSVAGGIVAWPLLRRYSERLALAYLLLSAASFVHLAIENTLLRQMLALSTTYAAGQGRDVIAAIGPVVRETWRQAHFANLVFAHAAGFMLHFVLFRFALAPRVLTAAGMAAALFAMVSVANPLIGGTFKAVTMAPVAVVQLALIAWLIVRGLKESPAPAS
jgi:hypothetical protein